MLFILRPTMFWGGLIFGPNASEFRIPGRSAWPEGFFGFNYKAPSHLTVSSRWFDDTQELVRRAAVSAGQVEHVLAHMIQKFKSQFSEDDKSLITIFHPAMTDVHRQQPLLISSCSVVMIFTDSLRARTAPLLAGTSSVQIRMWCSS